MAQGPYSLAIGLPAAIYVGNSSDVAPLKKVLAQRTSGIKITENLPRAYVPGSNVYVQSGLYEVTLEVTFLAEDDTVWKMARGVSLFGGSDINDDPDNTKYAVFLLYPNRRAKKSFWFPELSITNPLEINYNKDRPTTITLILKGVNRDPSYELMSRDYYQNFTESYQYASFQERNPFVFP